MWVVSDRGIGNMYLRSGWPYQARLSRKDAPGWNVCCMRVDGEYERERSWFEGFRMSKFTGVGMWKTWPSQGTVHILASWEKKRVNDITCKRWRKKGKWLKAKNHGLDVVNSIEIQFLFKSTLWVSVHRRDQKISLIKKIWPSQKGQKIMEMEQPWPLYSNMRWALCMQEHTISPATWDRAWLWMQALTARTTVSPEKQYRQPSTPC